MKMSLLDMTQNILSRLDSDDVNSIGDSSEASQVALLVKNKYFDIIGRVELPEHYQLIQLDPSQDASQPVLMYIPSGISQLKWLKYQNTNSTAGTAPGYTYVNILPIQEFLDMTDKFNPTESDVFSFTFTGASNDIPGAYTFYYKNDRQPSFCTIISNYYVVFDTYDATVDTTLQSVKTKAFGRVIPEFLMEDNFIPDLPEEQFQLLLNEATALAFFELKQQPHSLAMQEVKRGWSTVQKNKSVIDRPTYFNELANFGRRSGNYYGTRGFNNGN